MKSSSSMQHHKGCTCQVHKSFTSCSFSSSSAVIFWGSMSGKNINSLLASLCDLASYLCSKGQKNHSFFIPFDFCSTSLFNPHYLEVIVYFRAIASSVEFTRYSIFSFSHSQDIFLRWDHLKSVPLASGHTRGEPSKHHLCSRIEKCFVWAAWNKCWCRNGRPTINAFLLS